MVISELGVSQDTWTKAIGSFRSDFFSLPSAGYVPSTSQLLQPIRGSKYRGWRWFQGARHFSSLARHDTLGRRRTGTTYIHTCFKSLVEPLSKDILITRKPLQMTSCFTGNMQLTTP
ncbi:hypothetical protein GBAR_LOCUS10488, partial [Geodia barretti]